MAEGKVKKTELFFGVGTATDLITAKANATLTFGCQITSIDPPKITRGEQTDDEKLCTVDNTAKFKDTDAMEVSDLTLEGLADVGDAGYDATIAMLKTALKADTELSHVLKHPLTGAEQWCNIKLKEIDDNPRGNASDKIKFTLVAVARSLYETV